MTESPRKAVVFCDFDGTITTEDMIVGVWRQFAPPGWESDVRGIFEGRQTLKDGVAAVFAKIPSAKEDEIIAHVQRIVKFRQGFAPFLDFCEASGVGFTVCSGGIDFFVHPVLAPYRARIKKIYTIPADLSGPMIRLRHTMTCGSCGLCKAMAMEEHPGAFKILIGDSLTDLHGAEKADLVFARAKLKEILTQQGKPFEPYETFDEIRETLTRKYPEIVAGSGRIRS